MENTPSTRTHPTLRSRTALPPASTTVAVSLPVVGLSLGCYEVRRAVFDASKDLGFFQAVTISLPVVDLSLGRNEVRSAVFDAGKDLGFFQWEPMLN